MATTAAETEEREVLDAIEQVFEGMRQADSAMVREVFAPDARFMVLQGGSPVIEVRSPERWLDAIDSSGGKWDEQIYDVEMRVDGAMASAWVPYTFYRDGALSHCGVNSIELLRDTEGWKVTQISDTRYREDCPER
ncbi:MAG: nuclear transport factor 2 family protein [Pseudomonadota bacterium]